MFNFFKYKKTRNLVYNLIKYDEAKEMIFNENNILIDVREPNEYNSMHIINAVNIPVSKIRISENEYRGKKTIIVYCSSGTRAKEAIRILNGMGYFNIYIWEYASLANFPYKNFIKFK